MNIRQTLQLIVPKPSILVGLLAVPIGMSGYFFVTLYSNKFLLEQEVGYFDVQNSFVRTLLFDNSISEWFTRASDFLFWGVLAAITLVIAWAVSAAKTTKANHEAVQQFQNFSSSASSWHTHFIVQIVAKILLVIISFYLLFALMFSLTPALIETSAALIDKSGGIADVLLVNLKIYLYVIGVATAIKAFRHITVE